MPVTGELLVRSSSVRGPAQTGVGNVGVMLEKHGEITMIGVETGAEIGTGQDQTSMCGGGASCQHRSTCTHYTGYISTYLMLVLVKDIMLLNKTSADIAGRETVAVLDRLVDYLRNSFSYYC